LFEIASFSLIQAITLAYPPTLFPRLHLSHLHDIILTHFSKKLNLPMPHFSGTPTRHIGTITAHLMQLPQAAIDD